MRRCTKCGEEKDLSSFGVKSSHKDGLNPWCKRCVNTSRSAYREANIEKVRERQREWYRTHPEYEAEWRVKNPDKAKAKARRHHLKANYGISWSEYDAMLVRQGACARYAASMRRIRDTSIWQ